MRLGGKAVLVTGAASGIGYAICALFASEGAIVFASDITSPGPPYPDGIERLNLDVTSEDDWEAAVDTVVEKCGRLDVLVNNAGIIAYEPLHELEVADWQKLIAVDQTGVFLGMREAVRIMRRQKSGSIVNVSSIWDHAAIAGAHSYHAAKGAVRTMSKNAAMTYVADGIRVNSVHPGFIHTPLTDAQAPALNAAMIAATPMKRGGTSLDVAYGCLYLASDEASFVTGAELVIDGGYLAQ
jgi:NAD(P)-dependent dehydrogenase (short-subunit alcohol dehydrogenase family)